MSRVLAAAGADEPSTEAVTRALIEASTRGTDSHGIILFPRYVQALEGGRVNGRPRLRYEQRAPAVGYLDADNGFGHLAGYRAIAHAMEAAAKTGVAAVAVGNSSHYGAAACYSLAAARAGFAAFSFSHSDAVVALHNGLTAFNGTNPIAFAAPVPGEEPLSVDLATSAAAWNRLVVIERRQGRLPPETAIDAAGADAATLEQAAALLPLGGRAFGHKGAALAAMVEVLCSVFCTMQHGFRLLNMAGPDFSTPRRLGHFFMVLDPKVFLPAEDYAARMRAYLDDLRAQPAVPGERVQAPGEPEAREAERRRRDGIPVDAATWSGFEALAERYGVAMPVPISG
ncbi:MAG: Ldh family oxidoreductase [Rhodospirillaceae bacterium]|nr:Ldh family oxidoreductase [Rhodospirillaceae bacterium]